MTKLTPDWVRTSDPVIRSPARWTTGHAYNRLKWFIVFTSDKMPQVVSSVINGDMRLQVVT